MKVKNIIQVSAYYPPHLGGQENVVHDLAQQLAKAGHRVEVLTSSKDSKAGVDLEGGVEVRRLRGLVFGHAPIMPAMPARLFREAKKDAVVHLHIGQAFTPETVWLVSKLRHFKYIAELHIDFEPSGPVSVLLPLYKQLILRRVLQSAQSVVALNERTLHAVREKYGYKGPSLIVRNGIDDDYYSVERQAPSPEPPQVLHLLFVGRLSKQKNLPALIRALMLTKRKVHLDILGDGEERGHIEELIVSSGLPDVIMHGRQDRRKIMEFYKNCDALIMSSMYEAQPLVLLEALAAGVPIIGTNVIGVEEHIRGAGIVVDPTAEGLADGIDQYYTRYSLLGDMVSHGRLLAEKFRWRNVLQEYERLYETVAGY